MISASEHDAGDLDDADYDLRDDYTVLDAVIRSIDDLETEVAALHAAKASPTRRVAWIVATLAGAILAGVLVARTAGERGVGDSLTGAVPESIRDQVLECQQLGTQGAEGLQASLVCFDTVLDQDPNNVEALTYRAWYLSLVAASASEQGFDDDAAELYTAAAGQLDRAIEVDTTFPDAHAFRAVVADRMGDPERACSELAELGTLDAPPMMGQLTASLDERLDCAD
ncbi:MAG: tetratricopeptide repeat protein [Acidimicrobiales bacterium]